jgi:hypothetical protein
MRPITPGIGIALALGGIGVVAGGLALANVLGDDDHAAPTSPHTPVGPTPSPSPGPSPRPTPEGGMPIPVEDVPFPTETGPQPWTQPTRIDGLVDQYMALYDHSGDGEIDLGWGQQFGTDERVTGDVGNIHTMVEFFRDADTDGNKLLTRDELRGAISVYDTSGTIGFNPNGQEFGDGILAYHELARYEDEAIQAHSDPLDHVDTKGVPQLVFAEDGTLANNEGFFRALPDYRALD